MIPRIVPWFWGQVVGEYDSEFDYGYGYADRQIFPPYRRPFGVDVLENIVHPPSSPVTVSCNEGTVISTARDDMAENAFYNHTLRWGFARVSFAG